MKEASPTARQTLCFLICSSQKLITQKQRVEECAFKSRNGGEYEKGWIMCIKIKLGVTIFYIL